MNTIPLFKGASGLADKLDSTRIPWNPKDGTVGLAQADNIMADITGAMVLRDGFTLLKSGVYKSVFQCDDYGFCIEDGYLTLVNSDRTTTHLSSIGDYRTAFARHIDDGVDSVYYSNGFVTGIVKDKINGAWSVPAYVGIQSTEARIKSFMNPIPAGHILGFFNGRMYIAKDNMIYPSEKQAFSWFDESKAYALDSRIRMMRFVTAGLYVSTETQILFFSGHDIDDFGMVKVYDSPAIEGTDVTVQTVNADINTVGSVIFFAVSGRGICSADNSGVVTNYTDDLINFPEGSLGSAYLDSGESRYVVTIFS
jgi:hypothetical protein